MLYHLLSGKTPPSSGITPEQIRSLGLSVRDARMLEQMVAAHPSDRIESAPQLCRQLAHTKEYEPLPEVFFIVTDPVRKTLVDTGLIARSSNEAASSFLEQEELGGDHSKELAMLLEKESNKIRILTDRFSLVCIRDSQVPALVILGLYDAYPADLERQKKNAAPLRYRWKVTAFAFPLLTRPHLERVLDQLFDQLQTHQRVQQAARLRKTERKDFTRMWDAVLNLQRKQLDAVPKLSYNRIVKNANMLTFSLKYHAPDDLGWPDGTPIAFIEEGRQPRYFFVGYLLGISGKQVQVSWSSSGLLEHTQPYTELPPTGIIGRFQQEARAALDRQRWALNTLLNGGTVNSRLIDVLLDLSLTAFDNVDPSIEFYQPDLAEDKQNAVRQALAAQDLFLLQGPPGTGKTTTLAEIILQILNIKPDARILVSSQSNVAVNHILTRVAELCGANRVEIVRIGRAEKIGQGAEEWTLEQRLEDWRKEVLERTHLVLKTFKSQIKDYKQQRKQLQELSPEEISEHEQCHSWLEELESDLQEFNTDEQRLSILSAHLSLHAASQTEDTNMQEEHQKCQNRIIAKREHIASVLERVRLALPESAQLHIEDSLSKEHERLHRIVLNRLGINEEERLITKRLELVKRWQKIFGKKEDFAEPILDRATIMAATCLTTGGYYLKDQEFDWAIIDEAGRATAAELLVPLVRARRAIIVGDEKQLPPMVDEELRPEDLAKVGATRESLAESLFGMLVTQAQDAQLPVVQMLTVQHRMHPAIGRLISNVFYEGKLEHSVNEADRDHGLDWLPKAVTWFSTTRLPQHGEMRQGSSFYNRSEVKGIEQLLRRMENSYRVLGGTREVAIITPYNAQISELEASIQPSGPDWQALKIEIAAIDAFQGRDRDIVLYSTVRSNKNAQFGFLRDRRRLNVALSRARQLLILVGDVWTLENGRAGADANPYQDLVKYIRENPQDCALEDLEGQ